MPGFLVRINVIRENNEMVETFTFIRPIEKAPTRTDLCLFGQDGFGLYQIPFPCRLEKGRWINAHLRDAIQFTPVGWKPWGERNRRVKLGRSNDPQPTFPSTTYIRDVGGSVPKQLQRLDWQDC
jgi:hypothetical protein